MGPCLVAMKQEFSISLFREEADTPFLASLNVVCTFSYDLNLRVQSEEPVWKNLFLFQERARKIFVPIIKVEI